MNSCIHKTLLALACCAAFPVSAQTVTTPPRTISSQQETQGVDSTFQGNVQPNTQGSGFTVPIPTAPKPPPPPPPPPPPVTCTATASSRTITQPASCPAGYLTAAGQSSFTQSATQTTSTTCPAGAYGSPSTSTSTSGWSPSPSSACTVATARQLALNGGNYRLYAAHNMAGSTYTARATLYATVAANGTYAITYSLIGSQYSQINGQPAVSYNRSGTLASGTWLPPGRSASDFTVTITSQPSSASAGPYAYAGSAIGSTACLQDPNNRTAAVSTSASGSTGALMCMESGGHSFIRFDPVGDGMAGSIIGNVIITIRDNRYGTTASSSFAADVADGY